MTNQNDREVLVLVKDLSDGSEQLVDSKEASDWSESLPFYKELGKRKKSQMSRVMRKPTMWFLIRSNTNWSVPSQKNVKMLEILDI